MEEFSYTDYFKKPESTCRFRRYMLNKNISTKSAEKTGMLMQHTFPKVVKEPVAAFIRMY